MSAFALCSFVPMLKPFFFIFLLTLLVCNTSSVFAQQGFLLKGVIFNRQNGQRVANAFVSNQNNKITVASNDLGWFSIKATVRDTLKISKKDYMEYVYVVVNEKDVILQFSSVIQLNEVKIVGQSKKQELDEALRQYRSQGSFYNGKPPARVFLAAPITGLYELFGKTPKQAKHFQEFSNNETRELNVDKRFNKSLIKQVTDLREEQLQPFMDSYRPSFDQLSAWNDYDLIDYVKKSALGFKEGKGLPPLKKLY